MTTHDKYRMSGGLAIKLDLPVVGKSFLEVYIPPHSVYPNEVPVICFKNDRSTPKFKRKVVEKLVEECEKLLESAMIYSLTLWLNMNIAAIDVNEETATSTPKKQQQVIPTLTQEITTIQEHLAKKLDISLPKARKIPKLTPQEQSEVSKRLFSDYQKRKTEDGFINLKKSREKLPIFSSKVKFLEMLEKNQVIVLTGETGSGKTTQVSNNDIQTCILFTSLFWCRFLNIY